MSYDVIYVANLNEYARTHQRYVAFQEHGHNVRGISIKPIGELSGLDTPSLWYRLWNKLGRPPDRTNINRKIKQAVESDAYDLLWIEKSLMLRPETLNYVRRHHPEVTCVFSSEDDMTKQHNQSVYFRKCLPLYDLVFTTKRNREALREAGARDVFYVDKAYGKYTNYPMETTEEDRERFGADVIFIGSYERDRADHLYYLARNGVPVRVWGSGWERCSRSHPNVTMEHRPIYNEKYTRAICSSKIVLNFLRKINDDVTTDRTMEIPACGAFMLAERTEDHQRLFEEGEEAEFFDSKEELLEKVRYYLEHDDERRKIAQRGRARCVKSGYSHHDRLEEMLDQIKKRQLVPAD